METPQTQTRKRVRKDSSHTNVVSFKLSHQDIKRLNAKAQRLDLTRGEVIRRGLISFLEQA